jgi:hypothetical protein
MKLPIFCYTCGKFIGHNPVSLEEAKCISCGNVRPIPYLHLVLITIGVGGLLGLLSIWMYYAYGAVGLF